MENKLLISLEKTFENCLEIAKAKNQDYSSEKDPLANFNNSLVVGVSPQKGIMIRMMDKISRISNLLEKEAAVKNESIYDTLDDLINYAAILKYSIQNKNEQR